MELYTLDSLLRRRDVIDTWVSLIWTERYAAEGDFSLVLAADNTARRLLQANTMLALRGSDRVMIVKTMEDKVSSEGEAILTIKGVSLESILRDRFIKKSLSNTTVEKTWDAWDFPGNVIREMFQLVVLNGIINNNDWIPYIQPGQIMYPTPSIPESEVAIRVHLEPQSLYQATKDLCEAHDMGFRLTRQGDNSKLFYQVYTGNDLTTQQTVRPAMVISTDLENMRDVTEFTTFAGVKNVAYVFSPVGYEIVYADGVDSSIYGFDRQVMVVNATDITDTDPVIASERMITKGREELAKVRGTFAFDGEIDPYLEKVYGVDYNLGDLITAQSPNGSVNGMKITEQIFVSDREGERSYPTLSLRSVINSDSWLAWDFNQVWADLGSESWNDQ